MRHSRLAAAALVAGLAVTTAACGGGSTSGSGGKVQLTVWDPGLLTKNDPNGKVDLSQSFLHIVAKQYEKAHPDTTVRIVQQTGDISANSAQFQAASIAKNGPDVRIGYTGGNTLTYGKFLLDLDGVFDDATKKDLTGWNTVRAGYKPDGKLLALPYGGGSYFTVFYSKKAARAAGLDLSSPPATWEDLIALGEQARSRTGRTPFWVANQEGYVGAWLVAALAGGQLGPDAFTSMYARTTAVDSPAMTAAYQAYAALFGKGLANPDAGSVSNGDALAGFKQGKGIFYFSGGWDNKGVTDGLGDDAGVFMIPMLSGAKYPHAVAGGPNVAVSVTTYSKHRDQAEDFLRFLARPTTLDQYVKLFQTEPSNSARADSSVIDNPLLKTEAEAVKASDAVVFPFDSVMPQATIDLFYKVNASTFLGKTSPQDAVSQLQSSATTELENQ